MDIAEKSRAKVNLAHQNGIMVSVNNPHKKQGVQREINLDVNQSNCLTTFLKFLN